MVVVVGERGNCPPEKPCNVGIWNYVSNEHLISESTGRSYERPRPVNSG